MSAEIFTRLVERVKRARADAGPAPVVVFDLDGTVFDNGPRTWQILVEFAETAALSPLRRALDALRRQAAALLHARGQTEDAISLLIDARAWPDATRLICELAESLGFTSPTLANCRAQWERLVHEQGLGEIDHSGLFRLYES